MAVRIADENGTEPQSDRTAVKNVTCTGTGASTWGLDKYNQYS